MKAEVRLRVLHVTPGLCAGGAEAMLAKVAGALSPIGIESRVLSLGGRGLWGPRMEASGIRVLTLHPGSWRHGSAPWLPDLIQGWMYHGNLAATALGLALHRPVAWNIRATWDPGGFGKLSSRSVMETNRILSKQPEIIVCNSHIATISHRTAGFQGEWHLIPNGFELERYRPDPPSRARFRARLGLGEEALLIGMAARLHPMKDHASLLAAWHVVSQVLPTAHLVLAGQDIGPSDPILHAGLRGQGGERIHLLGQWDDMPEFQTSLDLAVLSSAYGEGFPNTMGEAMACEVPCVATDTGDSALLVGPHGAIVPPRDPEALANAILQVLALPLETRQDLGREARQHIENCFSIQAIARRYADLYQAICTNFSG